MSWSDIKLWEGAFIDLWSIPHFITGAIIALIAVIFQVSFLTGFFVIMLISVAWELYEILANIYEIGTNSVFDIVISLVAYSIFFYLPKFFGVSEKMTVLLLIIISLALLVAAVIGWIAYGNYSSK